MSHEFSTYSPEEQEEFLSIVKQMKQIRKTGDWVIDPFEEIPTPRLVLDPEKLDEPNIRLPQAHDLLEMLKEQQYLNPSPSTHHERNFQRSYRRLEPSPITTADIIGRILKQWLDGKEQHLCLALARAVAEAME